MGQVGPHTARRVRRPLLCAPKSPTLRIKSPLAKRTRAGFVFDGGAREAVAHELNHHGEAGALVPTVEHPDRAVQHRRWIRRFVSRGVVADVRRDGLASDLALKDTEERLATQGTSRIFLKKLNGARGERCDLCAH